MIELADIKKYRDIISKLFSKYSDDKFSYIPLSDKEALLTGRIFSARSGKKIIQISLDNDVSKSFFFKEVGENFELCLLQIIFGLNEFDISIIDSLFRSWMIDDFTVEEMENAFISW